MNFNDLLRCNELDPKNVLVLRHRPSEPQLYRVFPWIAAEKPVLFNAYQQTQSEKLEKVMVSLSGKGHIASFIGREAGKALFIGLYAIGKGVPLTYREYWDKAEHKELRSYGMKGFTGKTRSRILWFDMELKPFYPHWKGKLVVGWPPPERSWWRRAYRNAFPIIAVFQDSLLDSVMPNWDSIVLTWSDLAILPTRWKEALSQWRGIYHIFDITDGKSYVGSAYGGDNLLGRWKNYASRGHGGNRLLRKRDHHAFRFSILQRVSPDMEAAEVIQLESTWKNRLHTRTPFGLNDN